MVAVGAGLVVHTLAGRVVSPTGVLVLDRLFEAMWRWLQGVVGMDWGIAITATVMFAVPGFVAAFGVYALVTWAARGHAPDGETHCRACGQILRGLSEPRCPECGEKI